MLNQFGFLLFLVPPRRLVGNPSHQPVGQFLRPVQPVRLVGPLALVAQNIGMANALLNILAGIARLSQHFFADKTGNPELVVGPTFRPGGLVGVQIEVTFGLMAPLDRKGSTDHGRGVVAQTNGVFANVDVGETDSFWARGVIVLIVIVRVGVFNNSFWCILIRVRVFLWLVALTNITSQIDLGEAVFQCGDPQNAATAVQAVAAAGLTVAAAAQVGRVAHLRRRVIFDAAGFFHRGADVAALAALAVVVRRRELGV